MERIIFSGKNCIVGYHTQEHRYEDQPLESPICCFDNEAWLGVGHYFWVDLTFAKYWGEDKKMTTGAYDVYKANIESDLLINAVFDEEGYNFFVEKIEYAVNDLLSKNSGKVTLERVNRFLSERVWVKLGITGIIYDDLPKNPADKNRIYSRIVPLYYRKRIQIITFGINIIHNFDLYLDEQGVA